MCRDVSIKCGTAEFRRQGLRPLHDPEAFQKHALRRQPCDRGGGGGGGQRLEIDMRGQVGGAGMRQRILVLVPAQGLQRVAQRAPVAVVDDQRSAAVAGDAMGDGLDDRCGGGAGFDKVALMCVVQPVCQGDERRRGAEADPWSPSTQGAQREVSSTGQPSPSAQSWRRCCSSGCCL